ncbi:MULTISPECIES: hypothetical protein [Pasteurellaceae]|uniref:hypothetical protein n=1 Tax=Pasteurellaceae TaxID=712 RepID=UPI000531D2B0|nr:MULTISPECIES: hypothetical protein [Pasteurellaceae]KGQ38741.1 hypothetical protein JP35_07875 [Gallibacterium anatis]WGE60014.1 hypothetical protein NYR73_04715 [Actinobacillus equuli subsp. haemolyticus]WGE61338.1 hypothetical protein NYR74_00720 [Actinobacillus equuli subsp. haemolyticus]WGE76142.1 hypothetical protein NYR81_04175 [Actinobacillus equuli subsp. haemolyticus]WGE77987.1 hypothetical protein NYR82_03840 [Actinobacillus equuli subsp. haemolyticus]
MEIFLFIYMLGISLIYQRLRRLLIIYYIPSVLIILLVSKGLEYFYPDVESIQFIANVNIFFISLDVIALFIGVVYRFGYLKTKILNQAQLDSLSLMPTFALFPRILLYPSARDIHDDFWRQYKDLK